ARVPPAPRPPRRGAGAAHRPGRWRSSPRRCCGVPPVPPAPWRRPGRHPRRSARPAWPPVACCCSSPAAARPRCPPPPPARTGAQRWLLGLGALAVAGYPATFYPAVARAGVAVATVIALGSAPVFAGLLAWATGQGRPSARWAAATVTAVLGCCLLVLGPAVAGHGGQARGTGIGLAMLAGLWYATYSLIRRP